MPLRRDRKWTGLDRREEGGNLQNLPLALFHSTCSASRISLPSHLHPLHVHDYIADHFISFQKCEFLSILFRKTDQRRNNVEFRRNLLKERKKLEKVASAQASRARASQGEALKNAVREMRNERTPQSVEEREAYFLEQVAMGEALAAQGELAFSISLYIQ